MLKMTLMPTLKYYTHLVTGQILFFSGPEVDPGPGVWAPQFLCLFFIPEHAVVLVSHPELFKIL